MMGPLVWAQAQSGAINPNSLAPLALRRWFSGLTLSSPQVMPSFHGLAALLAGLGVLFLLAAIAQGPRKAILQLFDLPGHFRLVRDAMRRVWMSTRMVAGTIAFTVLAWTGAQAMVYNQEGGRADLLLLTKARRMGELTVEQGILAGLTPLRDVAGLGDNLPLLVVAAILVFRMSIDPQKSGEPGEGSNRRGRPRPGWTTLVWGVAALYILYRSVSRAAGSGKVDLPLGGCLIVEAVLIPMAMVLTDGFLLAWILAELRNAAIDVRGENRLDPLEAIALLPAATLACAVALPSRYIATFVFLAQAHLPTSISTTALGDYIRWQLGWGPADLQAAALPFIGLIGVVAWSRGRFGEAIGGYRRLLTAEGGHLVVALAMASVAAATFAGAAYAVVLLLPTQTWVLGAADAYAHFATLPVGLWTLAALIVLAERSLPTASRARTVARQAGSENDSENEPARQNAIPAVVAPTS
ncbi:MAG: hypothetical protein ACLQGP_04730 [Isosphaeraceae bacterium]